MSKRIDALLVEAEAGSALYAAERKVYPRDVHGRHDTLRRVAVLVLLGMFYTFPWLRWDGRQAVLFDLPARKFHVFGFTFWPQDFIFLAMLLMIAGLSLFFFTAVAGRLWCGYACPQTVWTETFLWMERLVEGDRGKRMKLDAAPWSVAKLLRKGAKHALWITFALWTGFTFVGFFTPIHDLVARTPLAWSGWETFWTLFYSFATWGNAGFMREQVCKYMCPYARFQGAMFDKHTLIIAYDAMRGEPRGSRKRGEGSVAERGRGPLSPEDADRWVALANLNPSAANKHLEVRSTTGAYSQAALAALSADPPTPLPSELGDCIDDTLCVQVCPTGIDIRNGLQYECIACGSCIDACNAVMDRMGFPRGLVRYTTHNAMHGQPTHVLRVRVLIYGVLLLSLIAGWTWGVTHRSALIAEALRDRNALYRVSGGTIENVYTLKLVNKQETAQRYRISLLDASPVTLSNVSLEVDAPAGAVTTVPLTLQAPLHGVRGRKPLTISVRSLESPDVHATVETSFFGPM